MNATEFGKKFFRSGALFFLFFWVGAPAVFAQYGFMQGSASEQAKAHEAYAQFQNILTQPPPTNSNCKTGHASGQCMTDYCGTDVNEIVTACLSPATAQKINATAQGKCWQGYGCGGPKNVCCVVSKSILGECNHDYEGKDWGGVTFKCVPTEQECTSKYPGGSSAGGGYGCSSGICCKMPKSVAQLSQTSECNFDYSGSDKANVHFVCTENDSLCKLQNGTPSGKGLGCPKTADKEATCCKLTGNYKEFSASKRKEEPINTFCFTASECQEASGDIANWRKDQGCTNKGGQPQGYCIAPEPDYNLQYPIMGVKTIRGLKNFIALLFNTGIGILIIASAIFFVWGAFKYMVSAVGAEISTAKSTMVDSMVGLALGLSAFAILANVNPNTLNFKTFDIKMINRLSFFNLKFCRDIPRTGGKELKFMDAGTPENPKNFATQFKEEGYKTAWDKTVCGTEYFVEGGGATDICQGGSCASGVCVNCAGKAEGCRSTSVRQTVCAHGVAVGNVISKTAGDEISLDFVCLNTSTGKTWTKELGSSAFGLKQTGTGVANGMVGNYIITDVNKEEVDKNFSACAKEGSVGGAVLVAQLKGKYPGLEAQSFLDRRYVLNKKSCTSGGQMDICNQKIGSPVYVIGSNAMAGAYYGFAFSPLGSAIGATVGAVMDFANGGLDGFIQRMYENGTSKTKENLIGMIQKNGFSQDDLTQAIGGKSIDCSFICKYDGSEFANDPAAALLLEVISLSGN